MTGLPLVTAASKNAAGSLRRFHITYCFYWFIF
jgi:hypothetical protein